MKNARRRVRRRRRRRKKKKIELRAVEGESDRRLALRRKERPAGLGKRGLGVYIWGENGWTRRDVERERERKEVIFSIAVFNFTAFNLDTFKCP